MIQIKQATLEDIPAVSDIFKILKCGKRRWSRKKLRNDFCDEGRRYYILIEGNNPVGAISLDFITGDCEVEAIAVIKKSKGYGTKLLRTAEQIARDKQCASIWCYSMDYYGAKGFYKSNGWTEISKEYDKVRKETTLKFARRLM